MIAWWAVLRHEARRHAVRTVLLAAFVAFGGGVVLSAVIGARREATAIDRMASRIHLADAAFVPNDPDFDWAPIAELPGVRALQRVAIAYVEIVDHPELGNDFPRVGPPDGEPVETSVLLAGRWAEEGRADEVTIGDVAAHQAHVRLGDRLTLRVLGADVLTALLAGQAPPDTPPVEVPVRIVGITRGGAFTGGVATTDAFYAAHESDLVPPGVGYVNALVRVDGGQAGLDEVSHEVDRIAGRPIEVLDVAAMVRPTRRATELETAALLGFAATAGLVVAVLGTIWMGRATGASAESLRVLRALGFTRRDGVTLAAALPAVGAVVGGLGAAVVAYGLSARYPIGLGRETEPTPGRHASVLGLVTGAVVIAALGVLAALVAARRAERRAVSAGPDLASRRWWIIPPLTVSIGARLALAGRRDGGSRAATAALGVGVVGVVAALTFGAGLARGATDATLSGQAFDSGVTAVGRTDPPTDLVEAWRDDDRVAWGARILNVVADVGGRPVSLFGVEDLKGTDTTRPLRGRLPTALGEVAFSPGEMRRLGVGIGDDVELTGGGRLRVVGEAFTPEIGHTGYNEGGRITAAEADALESSGLSVKFDSIVLRAGRPLTVDDRTELWHGREAETPMLPGAQLELGRTTSLPRVLAWFAGVLAAITAAVVLVTTTRRRRREVAVLQVLGLTRRQARRVVGWQVLVSVGVAVVVGVPLGFALGRTLWQMVVEGVPLRYVTPTAWAAVSLVVLGVAVLAAVLAAPPMRMTAAQEPGPLLRAE